MITLLNTDWANFCFRGVCIKLVALRMNLYQEVAFSSKKVGDPRWTICSKLKKPRVKLKGFRTTAKWTIANLGSCQPDNYHPDNCQLGQLPTRTTDNQECSWEWTRGNGVPTPFPCFALKWGQSCLKMACFSGCVPTPLLSALHPCCRPDNWPLGQLTTRTTDH